MERNKDEEITYEVVLKGKRFDCMLRNFFTDGNDVTLREDYLLPGGLVHDSKENILKKTFEDTIFLCADTFKRRVEKCKNEEDKELYSYLSEELKTLDYDKLQKNFIREKDL